MAGWTGAHELMENHTITMDKDLMNPNKYEIEKIAKEVEEENKSLNLKQKELDNILMHSKKKLIIFCTEHININFQMIEIARDLPEIKPHHYRRLYELAKKDLYLKGFELTKNGKAWVCTKAVK